MLPVFVERFWKARVVVEPLHDGPKRSRMCPHLFHQFCSVRMLIAHKPRTAFSLLGWHFLSARYHIYVGYDAGYYGYGWADVYAADIFATMQSSKLGALSAETGRQLRSEILGPCATKSGEEMGFGMVWFNEWAARSQRRICKKKLVQAVRSSCQNP